MSIRLDYRKARELLYSANAEDISKIDLQETWVSNIRYILKSSHKTYKYILMTQLLAKAIDKNVFILALQAGASIDGAFDARSLCHKVIVPFERDILSCALGGSNEPYLNKPARFPVLSLDNAVRSGNDKEVLNKLIELLKMLKSNDDAYNCLCFALYAVNQGIKEKTDAILPFLNDPDLIEISSLIEKLLGQSHQGEVCAVLVGALEKYFYLGLGSNFKVCCHNSNESGASSNEIGDIDVYDGDKYHSSIEIKDKDFTVYDIGHAFDKMIKYGGIKGAFIYGPRANFDKFSVDKKLEEYSSKNFFTVFMNIYAYSRVTLFKSAKRDRDNFLELLMKTAYEMNIKDTTRNWINNTIHEMGWQ